MSKLPNVNINISVVSDTIGESSNNLSDICLSDKVNVWSKWKPFDCNTLSLNNSLIENNYYGFDVVQITSNEVRGILTKCITNDGRWLRCKPKGGELSPYRLGDFRNYNHQAVSISEQIYDTESANALVTITGRFRSDDNVEIPISDLLISLQQSGTSVSDSWRYAILFSKDGGDNTYVQYGTTFNGNDAPDGYVTVDVDLTSTGTGTYTCCMVLTMATDNDEAQPTIYMPNSLFTLKYDAMAVDVLIQPHTTVNRQCPIAISYVGEEYINSLTFYYEARNQSSTAMDAVLTLLIEEGGANWGTQSGQEIEIPLSKDEVYQGQVSYSFPTNIMVEQTSLQAFYSFGGTKRYINLYGGAPSQNEIASAPLLDIINSYKTE